MDFGDLVPIDCFEVVETANVAMYLRRYRSMPYVRDRNGTLVCDEDGRAQFTDEPKCPGAMEYHDKLVFVGFHADVVRWTDDGESWSTKPGFDKQWPKDSSLWPTHCDCGYKFQPEDEKQYFPDLVYRAVSSERFWPLRELPPGAMYYSTWLKRISNWDNEMPYDGLTVILPPDSYPWMVGLRANNCTLPKDRLHRCWVVSGTMPKLTASKNGPTCAAGAGSIMTPKYHGFLTDGQLIP